MPAIIFEKGINRTTFSFDQSAETTVSQDGAETKSYTCKQVIFNGLPIENNIKQAVMASEFPNDLELKLVNEYNSERRIADGLSATAAKSYLSASAKVARYYAFLDRRAEVFRQIEQAVG
jgi:hypothetical protein